MPFQKYRRLPIEENRKGYLSGGASIYYTPTIDTYKDDMEEITRKILSGEDIGIKGSIGTFMPDTFGIMRPTLKFPQTVPTAALIFILAALKTLRINTTQLYLLLQMKVCLP